MNCVLLALTSNQLFIATLILFISGCFLAYVAIKVWRGWPSDTIMENLSEISEIKIINENDTPVSDKAYIKALKQPEQHISSKQPLKEEANSEPNSD